MKSKMTTLVLLTLLSFTTLSAQDHTTVTATNSEISDNLDLRAIASIFGDSEDLADFERRLNDPKSQISNLDLNNDNEVDYLRVIESIEGNTHIVIIQSVLGKDIFQDIATIEVEKNNQNQVQVQVVGDVYMYGNNYIYEPVYVAPPLIYTTFWVSTYHPYYSSWYWGYYPSYYYVWAPYPVFRYRNHIGGFINYNHHYNYVNYRRAEIAYNSYRGRRANAYEVQNPTRSFSNRNKGFSNRQELDQTRNIKTLSPREIKNNSNPRNNTITPRGNNGTNTNPRGNKGTPSREINRQKNDEPRQIVSPRIDNPRATNTQRTQEVSPRGNNSRNEGQSRGGRHH